MPQVVNLLIILVSGVAPLYVALRGSRWSPARIKCLMVAVPVLLFTVNTPIHETSHMVGTVFMGGTIEQVRLWQPFWQSDAPVAMIKTSGVKTPTAAFTASVSPYVVDAALLALGAVVLRRPRIRSTWRFGAFFLFLVLKPSFDISANVLAGAVYGIGDFTQVKEIVGGASAGALQVLLVTAGIGLTLAVMRVYGPSQPPRSCMVQESEVERGEHQDHPDIRCQPFPNMVSEEQQIDGDDDADQQNHVKHDR